MSSQLSLFMISIIIVLSFFTESLLEATHIASPGAVGEGKEDDDEKKVERRPAAGAASPQLDKLAGGSNQGPRGSGCWYRSWICRERLPPFMPRLCCRNQCVDARSDSNNCGLCGIRCPFRWKCCNGFCTDVMINRFHCGECNHRCPVGSFCLYGLCGYAEPHPPFPSPHPLPPQHPKGQPPPPPLSLQTDYPPALD